MRKSLAVAALLVGLVVLGQAAEVWRLRIEGEIGNGTVSYLQAGLAAAEAAGAVAVVIEFSTPGGYLDAATACRDAILGSGVRTIAYVNREAYSAGALLAIACERIFFAPGGVMGAATPVYFDAAGEMKTASEKVVSAVRALFRATAEERGRDPDVAEAMVDPDVAIPGLVDQGKLLTLTARSALEWGYSDGDAPGLAQVLDQAGLGGRVVTEFAPRWVDAAVDVLTTPWLAALLIAVGVLGLLWEVLTPGFGVPGSVGIAALGLFFWAHYLAGLAGWESIVFLVAGVVAILLEIFVFTGTDFGLAGIAGLVLFGLGFYTAMVGPFTHPAQVGVALSAVSLALVGGLILTAVVLTQLPRSRLRLGGVILQSTITGRAGDKGEVRTTEWVGRRGVAVTDLRPAGAGEFAGERVDIVAEEGFILKESPIVIVRDEGYRKVVRELKEA
jgi:membrane-bound serine protease (ClpP class)